MAMPEDVRSPDYNGMAELWFDEIENSPLPR